MKTLCLQSVQKKREGESQRVSLYQFILLRERRKHCWIELRSMCATQIER